MSGSTTALRAGNDSIEHPVINAHQSEGGPQCNTNEDTHGTHRTATSLASAGHAEPHGEVPQHMSGVIETSRGEADIAVGNVSQSAPRGGHGPAPPARVSSASHRVRKARPEERSESSIVSGIGASMTSFWSGKHNPEADQLLYKDEIIQSLKQQLRTKPSIQEWNNLIIQNDELKKENAGLRRARDRFQQTTRQLEAELRDEKQHVIMLETDIREQEDIVAKAHTSAFDRLTQDVSTAFPDDKIRRELRRVFEEDLLGWCMDYSLPKIGDPSTIKLLTKEHILADEKSVPPAYRMSLESDTTAAVLLMAALATDLCDIFLCDKRGPFLRAEWLTTHVEKMSHIRLDHQVNWRMRTCELIEASLPDNSHFFERLAKGFATEFACLIDSLGDRGLSELVEIYETFGKLALKMWQRKTMIRLEGLDHPDFKVFRAGVPGVETDSTVRLEAGSTALDGRPIYAMVRPRIVSEPVLAGGRLGGRVIWSNAVVWVAPQDRK